MATQRPFRRALAGAVAALLLGACRAEVTVGLEVDRSGGGQVQVVAVLDAAARRAVGDVRSELAFDDLRRAGWQVDRPRPRPGGGVEVAVWRRFRSPAEGERLLRQLAGRGALEGVRLHHERGLIRTTTSFAAMVDLRQGLAAFGDDDLTAALGGEPGGVPPGELERQLGRPLAEAVRVALVADLPGRVEADQARSGDRVSWPLTFGRRVRIEARSATWNVPSLALSTAALLAALSAVALVVIRREARLGRARRGR